MRVSFFFPWHGTCLRLSMGVLIIAVLLVEALGISVAHASGGGARFSIEPVYFDPANPITRSYFIFNGRPLAQVQNSLRVTNSGSARGTVSLYPVDATSSQTSGTVFLNRNDARRDVGAWITMSNSQLTLDPGQSQDVPFQLAIPSAVRPGQHVGGIVAEDLYQQTSKPGQIQINVRQLSIVAVLVNLPGTLVEQLVATGIQYDESSHFQRLLVGLNNSGTMLLKPFGSLQVSDLDGHLLQNLKMKLDTILPQNALEYPVYIQHKALADGKYTANLSLTYGHNQVLHYTTTFTIKPPANTIPGVISNLVTPGPDFFSLLSPWEYVVGVIILLLLVSGSVLWVQRLFLLVGTLPRRGRSKKVE